MGVFLGWSDKKGTHKVSKQKGGYRLELVGEFRDGGKNNRHERNRTARLEGFCQGTLGKRSAGAVAT